METKIVSMRAKSIRLRTWLLTLFIVIALLFYLAVNINFGSLNLIDFIVVAVIQSVAHLAYFPDGELFGMECSAFVSNKNAYNEKASRINENRKVAKLREYCEWEYNQRIAEYTRAKLGIIGITEDEFEKIKELPEKEIRKRTSYEIGGKLIFIGGHKKKTLLKLIFGKMPIDKNHAETILSAVETNGFSEIRDGSIAWKTKAYILKFAKVIVWGGFLSYVVYSAKDGFGIAEVAKILTYLSSLLTTAVTSYSSGEKCTKIYKNKYYIDLSNFIDCFEEWELTSPQKCDIM